MCGIVGAVAQRDVLPILLQGLKCLEYRGYDSAGVAILHDQAITRVRTQGKVAKLVELCEKTDLPGGTGVAHTRWATHGVPNTKNAHPHMSGDDIALVHNGIIENHADLKAQLLAKGYTFSSDTDTEIIVHGLHYYFEKTGDFMEAIKRTVKKLDGAFALGIIHSHEPDRLIAIRQGSPLVIGLGFNENFIASDQLALLPVTQRFIHLNEGDVADISRDNITIYDDKGKKVEREIKQSAQAYEATSRGEFRHFMLKEIFEQPEAIRATLNGRLHTTHVLDAIFGTEAETIFKKVQRVQIVACGTSYHAGLIAKHWLESIAGIPCLVDIASEYRYRDVIVESGALFLTISQSGETADTLAALHKAKKSGYTAYLAICNVPESSLPRESDLTVMTYAGTEIGVASTKAFTTQLVALLLVTVALARRHGLTEQQEAEIVAAIRDLPKHTETILELDSQIAELSQQFVDKHHALFLGRGIQFPVALEGALKLKEISYIHAEAYPAGELKHGPLALVDDAMPIIAIVPNNKLYDKLCSNLAEVKARGGQLYLFADKKYKNAEAGITVITMPDFPEILAPILYTIPLQLLAYHVAVLKGTDVDQPRNLAKSVTVE